MVFGLFRRNSSLEMKEEPGTSTDKGEEVENGTSDVIPGATQDLEVLTAEHQSLTVQTSPSSSKVVSPEMVLNPTQDIDVNINMALVHKSLKLLLDNKLVLCKLLQDLYCM